MKKQIDHILFAREKKITETETIRQPLPHKDFRFASPIIVIHHGGPTTIAAGSQSRIHPHPHRGFSPYTFMLEGEGFHRDNAGNDEVIKAGGVQWMFAGKGILHSEGPTENLLQNGGVQEFVQLWINAPKARKWDEPFYQAATAEEQPLILQNEGVSFRLASGSYEGKTGPIKNFTEVISASGSVAAGKQVLINATPGFHALLYIISGNVVVNGTEVAEHNLVVFNKEAGEVHIAANEDARLLWLSAEPLDEPVAAKDNFVMNTAEETEQAIQDYKDGVFGTLSY